MIHSFLPLLYMLQYAPVEEVHCSFPQPCIHGFLAFHVILVMVAFCLAFNISDTWYSGWSVCTLGGVGTKFPSILCKCLRHKTCCVKFCIFFWKGCVQLDTCHKVLITVSGACEHSEWHSCFFLCAIN